MHISNLFIGKKKTYLRFLTRKRNADKYLNENLDYLPLLPTKTLAYELPL